MNKLEDFLKHESDFKDNAVENNMITNVGVSTIAHYGNITSFEIECRNIVPYCGKNNIGNLGHVIKAFVELMELEQENGIRLEKMKDIPCRLVFDCKKDVYTAGSSSIAIGHFMKDQFIMIDDLAKIGIGD